MINVVFLPRHQDAEFTIEFEQLASWIADVKSAFNDELKEGGRANYRCLGLGYMWRVCTLCPTSVESGA
jgi:hypothetical protein